MKIRVQGPGLLKALGLILLLVLGGMALGETIRHPQFSDDAFITFRIARNLSQGEGPYFNPGERVQAMTTPLYMLAQAAGAWISGAEVTNVETALGSVGLVAIAVLLFCLGRSAPILRGGALVLPILLFTHFTSILQVKGMEAMWYVALILSVALAEARGWRVWVGIGLGLVAATRTEGGLLGMVYLAYFLGGRRLYGRASFPWKDLGKIVGLGLLAGLPFLLFVFLAYGSVLPSSVEGKMLQTEGWHSRFSVELFHYLISGKPLSWPSPWGALLAILFLQAALHLPRLKPSPRHYRALVLPGLFVVCYAGLFCAFDAPYYAWYLFPVKILLIPYYALVFAGLWRMATGRAPLDEMQSGEPLSLADTARLRARWPRVVGMIAFGLSVAYAVAWNQCQIGGALRHIASGNPRFLSDHGYRKIGRALGRETGHTGWTFAAAEIGILAYYSGLPCLDMAGLASPEARDYFLKEPLAAMALRFRPELYVTAWQPELTPGETLYDANLAREFDEAYRMVESHVPYDMPGARREIRVYVRRGLPWPPPGNL